MQKITGSLDGGFTSQDIDKDKEMDKDNKCSDRSDTQGLVFEPNPESKPESEPKPESESESESNIETSQQHMRRVRSFVRREGQVVAPPALWLRCHLQILYCQSLSR